MFLESKCAKVSQFTSKRYAITIAKTYINQEANSPGNNPRSLGISLEAASFFISILVLGALRALRLIVSPMIDLPLMLCWRGVDMKLRLGTECFLIDSAITVATAVAAVLVVEALVKKQQHGERDVRMVRGK